MSVRLPTLGAVVADAGHTLRRFPLVLGAAVVAATAAILGIESLGPEGFPIRLLAAATLGLPLFTALEVTARRHGSASVRWLFGGVGLLVLATFYGGWPSWSEPVQAARYFQLSAAFHLMAAFLPFASRSEPHAFWQYNRTLFERGIVAAIFSGTLFAGLALALLALHKLFGVPVPDEAYPRMWFVVVFVFNTAFFLKGVPEDPGALESRRDYPKGLKVFAQYLLVPIVSVYLVILTAYLAKVVVGWDWPSGWIGWLVSGVAVTGIFALLLVHPVAEDGGEAWVRAFARGFWLALLPATVMLWLAIWQRVQQYGITERRYFLLVLSVWLGAAAVAYGLTRLRDLRFIPMSLGILAILTFGGPWGAYHVSEASQVRRLAGLLERHGVLRDGRVVEGQGVALPFEARKEISAVLRYLGATHGLARIAPWFTDSIGAEFRAAPGDRAMADRRVRRAALRLGVRYADAWEPAEGQRRSYTATRPPAVALAGFDYLIRIGDAPVSADTDLVATYVDSSRVVAVRRGPEVLVTLPLDSVLARVQAFAQERSAPLVPPELLMVEVASAGVTARAVLRSLSVRDSSGTLVLTGVAGDVLLRVRP